MNKRIWLYVSFVALVLASSICAAQGSLVDANRSDLAARKAEIPGNSFASTIVYPAGTRFTITQIHPDSIWYGDFSSTFQGKKATASDCEDGAAHGIEQETSGSRTGYYSACFYLDSDSFEYFIYGFRFDLVLAAGTPPTPPTNASAIAGNGSATVSFTPASIGSGTLVKYWAACGIDTAHLITATGSSSPITVTGLSNGTTYYCWALTESTVGYSEWSVNTNSVIPTAGAFYNISTAASPTAGGSVTCSPNPVSSGSTSTCLATPNSGYAFSSWSGACSGSTATCSLSNVIANTSVTALFATSSSSGETPPSPVVTANQGRYQVLVMPDMLLEVTIKLDPQQRRGQNADWWLFAETGFGTFYYDIVQGWQSGRKVSYQAPLIDLPAFQVLSLGGLPAGRYVITFGVDLNMNGVQDADAYLDSVQVDISSNVACPKNTKDTLDALSTTQQKFIASRGNPDVFNIGFISENESQQIAGTSRFAYYSSVRRMEAWIYNRDQLSTALFDNGYFVEESTAAFSTSKLVPTQLSPSQFTSCMSRSHIIALMGEPSCTINESMGGRTYSYLRYNPGKNPAATVVLENGLLIAVMAGYSRAYTTADLCSDQ